MGQDVHALSLQGQNDLGRFKAAGVHLHRHGRLAVVPAEQGLQFFPVQLLGPGLDQPLGVAVQQGEVGRPAAAIQSRKLVDVPGQVPQDAVDQASGAGILAVFLRQLHRFVHGGGDGNFGEEEHLVQPQTQAVSDLALHFLQLHGGKLLDVVVQQKLILDHAEAQAGGQGGVPLVQVFLLDHFFQVAVGPGLLALHGHEGQQCGFSCGHAPSPSFLLGAQSTGMGCPRR